MKRLVCVILAFVALSYSAESVGLKVSPAEFILHGVSPGKVYDIYRDTGVRITIYNDNDTDNVYLITSHRPSEAGKWEKGYLEIPDAGWLTFDSTEVKIPAHGQENVNLFLALPEGERYYNQNWVVTIGIMSKPASGISLGVYVRVRIETERKERIKEKPDGLIGVVPGTLVFQQNETRKYVTIYNNTANTGVYKIHPLNDGERVKTYLSAGFNTLPEISLLETEETVRIPAGGKRKIPVTLNLPDSGKSEEKPWEQVVFVEGNNITGFFRVRTIKKNEN